MRFLLRSAFALLRKQLGINVMHERLALDEVMIHDIKLLSLLSYRAPSRIISHAGLPAGFNSGLRFMF
jgi:hypothetical protein